MRNNTSVFSKCTLMLLVWIIPVLLPGANRSLETFSQDDSQHSIRFSALPHSFDRSGIIDTTARIVVDRQTGEIIKGNWLALREARVNYHNLRMDIRRPKAEGDTGGRQPKRSHVQPVTIGQVVTALLTLSVQPSEIIEILESLIHEGVLRAQLIVQ